MVKRAKTAIEQHRDALKRLADALIERETLEGEGVRKIAGL